MQWMPLKLDLLPAISIETERTIELYQELAKQVANGQQRQQNKLNELRKQMKKRIEQLDQFYDQHCQDQRVALFHRLKLQMMKSIATGEQSKVEPVLAHTSSIKGIGKSPIGRQSAKATATMESTISFLRNSHPTKPTKTRQNVTAMPSQKSSKPSMMQSAAQFKQLNRQLKKIQHQPRQSTKDVKPQLYPTTKQKAPEPPKKQPTPLPQFKKSNIAKLSKPKQTISDELDTIVAMPPPPSEIVFTIKMTKEEYLEFLSSKQSRK